MTVKATPTHIIEVLADLPAMLEWSPADSITEMGRDPGGRPSLELGIGLWVWPGIRSRVESMIVKSALAALKRRVETD